MSDAGVPETLDHGRYRIDRVLGVGGTATVYLAHDTRMGVPRAIKVLQQDFALSKQNRARFLNEAHAQAGLKHQNVLMVHDVLDDDQGLYMVMELAESDSIAARVARRGVLTARECAQVGITVGNALVVAHAAGVIHRDIKPANILLDRHGVLKLADFGIARVLDRREELTRTGTVMGTWAYMPPEQREDTRSVDGRSDVYALGVTLHALLTGRHSPNLHNQEAYAEMFGHVPPALAAVIQKATRLYPEDRYQQMTEMVAALHGILAALAGPSFLDTGTETGSASMTLTGVQETAQVTTPTPINTDDGAPRRATAVPVDPTQQTWIADQSEPPPAHPPPGAPGAGATVADQPAAQPAARPVLPLLSLAFAAFVFVAVGGALVLPRLMDLSNANNTPPATDRPSMVAPVDAATPPDAAPTQPADVTAPETTPETGPTATPETAPTAPAATSPAPRRIITIVPGQGGSTAPSTAATDNPDPTDIGPTGTVVVRTVPSGASVSEGGRALSIGSNGGYALPVGGHVLDITSGSGEQHRVPIQVKAGRTVEICYSFDTNSACGATP